MKRAALPFLVLSGLVLLVAWLRHSSEGDPEQSADNTSVSAENMTPRVANGPSARNSVQSTSVRPNDGPSRALRAENGEESPTLTEESTALSAERGELTDELTDEPRAANDAQTEGPAPLKRYEDGDALALRRARQIELVMQAQQQARDSLDDAERRGDAEVAARTRGVIRRLQLRLDALETAASALEPY